ncbi:MAG: hypothetical protein JWQ23_2141 [Herminiimonas sp.]|nr:hypothetical protein [Herminiimonas sp.]
MNAPSLRPDRPPFQVVDNLGPDEAAQDIVASFRYFSHMPNMLEASFERAMQTIGLDRRDPLHIAGTQVVRAMDRGTGVGAGNAYHNAMHFCEVMLCTLFVAQLARLTRREQAQVVIASLLHDFHHDGATNGSESFRLELIACREAEAYLRRADVTQEEQGRVNALILSTEIVMGVPLARSCYVKHFLGGPEPVPLRMHPELVALINDPRLALQAVVLSEADILPSVGLTIEHADINEARLEAEIKRTLGPENKIQFIDHAIGEFLVAKFFMPNLRTIRKANLDRIQTRMTVDR